MAAATDQIVRRIETRRMEMEAEIAVLRQHVTTLAKLYQKAEQLSPGAPIVDRGGPAGRVDR
jgi:uncharacterized protein (DUF3084 family)